MFQDLDNTTKRGVQMILNVLQESRDQAVETAEEQTKRADKFHMQTQNILSKDIGLATTCLEAQDERSQALTTQEQRRSHTELLGTVADATSSHERVLSIGAGDISSRIEHDSEHTRTHIAGMLEINQEFMKQETTGLQRGLVQL